MSKLENFFLEVNRHIDKALDDIVPAESEAPARLNSAIRWSLLGGGKRFRPALLFAVGRTFGADDAKLITTAAAVEMIHTYSLIHDDLPAMDDDDLRRGRATCHKKFDEATAILAGDALQVLAFSAVADDRVLPVEMRLRLVSDLARASAMMVAGQQLDLDAEGKEVTASEVDHIHRNKTGALISFAARAGAILGDAVDVQIESVSLFAEKLGLLFQISDDILDVTQTTLKLGKTAAKDVSSHKATYPSVYGLSNAVELQRAVHAEAVTLLDSIDRPATLLKSIADFIIERES